MKFKSFIFFALIPSLFVSIARAESVGSNRSALIVGVSEYNNSEIPNLPGVIADIESAKKIALAMGIPEKNITLLKNEEATKKKIIDSFRQFSSSAADGGRAFIYFSGHGTRGFDPNTNNCYEGLLSYDGQAITHDEIASATKKLNDQVDKTIVMFDACHSGGVLNENLSRTRKIERALTPKFYSKEAPGASSMCYQASNFRTRGLFEKSTKLGALQENLVYITAARPDEVSYDEGVKYGGVATQAIRDCLLGGAKDLNSSGGVSLEEIQTCSQDIVNKKLSGPVYLPHHITIRGNRNLIPVANNTSSASSAQPITQVDISPNNAVGSTSIQNQPTQIAQTTNAVDSVHTTKPTDQITSSQASSSNKPSSLSQANNSSLAVPVKPSSHPPAQQLTNLPPIVDLPMASLATLKDIATQSNPTRKVDLQLLKKSLKINKDYLDLKIKSSHDGYLYLVLLGSDKKSFYILYPNKLDGSNRVQAGQSLNIPSKSWQIKASGPVGVDNILAIVSETPRDLTLLESLGSDPNSPFTYSLNNLKGRGDLINFLTRKGDYGTSEKYAAKIISVSEIN
jgi:hypothetical protein